MGAGPRELIDSPTARPGRSLSPDPAGGRGEGRDFLREAQSRPWKSSRRRKVWGGSGSQRPKCQGLSGASRTPGGAAGRGEPEGPEPGVSTLGGGRKLTFLAGSVVPPSLSFFRPPGGPRFVLRHVSLQRLALSVPPAALFPGRPGLGSAGGCAALEGHSEGRGSQPTPGSARGALPRCRPWGLSGTALWVGFGTLGE